MTTLELSMTEFNAAVLTANLRMAVSTTGKLNAATTYARTWIKRLEEEVVGACGELAVAKHLDRFLIPSVNTFHRVPDCIEDVEVRATAVPDGCLIVRDNDSGDRRFVLAVVAAPIVKLVGWMWGRDAKSATYVRNPHGHRSAWFVPQSALRPVEELNHSLEVSS